MGIVFGVADGITAGLLMTIAADLAPSECRSEYIAQFRMLVNLPKVLGPVIIGALCTNVSLLAASVLSAGIGGVSLFWIIFVLDDPKKHGQKQENVLEDKMMRSINGNGHDPLTGTCREFIRNDE